MPARTRRTITSSIGLSTLGSLPPPPPLVNILLLPTHGRYRDARTRRRLRSTEYHLDDGASPVGLQSVDSIGSHAHDPSRGVLRAERRLRCRPVRPLPTRPGLG